MVALDLPTTAPATTGAPDTRMTGRMRLVLVVLLVAQFMLAVDFSILNVALPVIGQGLGFTLGGLQWIATAFALAAAGFTLLFGRVADLVGRRRVFLGGMALLGIASLAGGLATGPELLMAARVAQGLATAAVTPAALSLLTSSFPEGPLRARALGLNGALMSAGFTTGAILGGVLTDLLSWRWAFLVNVPVALAVLLVAPAVLKESRPAVRPRLDVPGAITVTGGLLALVYGLTAEPWALPVGAALLIAFVLVERRAASPLVPVRILTRRTVVWGNLAGLVAFVTETSLVFLMTLYLQDVLGFSPLAAGLSFGVLGAGTVLGGVGASRFIARFGARTALVAGGLLQAAATLALYGLGDDRGSLWLLLAATFAGGVGNMLAIVGFMVTATSGIPDHEQGTATGLATMTQQIGITMGTPIMSAVVVTTPVLLDGIGLAVLVNAAIVVAGALTSAVFLRRA
ncbi:MULTISPECIES: MFS transporter [unclassified Streptomyces]|uniref:MFS transporter n=1 Tax=unclassified Streptomyces TaxID=2593676 RepID=UPI0006FB2C48|nr:MULTISPECIES: MFS transporter [unclassified Streptomyces]KQX58976.1 MFS transporter [Streptomyces sp. Root1304]KRB00237.1 MFS transporter [Streptomyces sp. Root66D1]